MTDAYLDLQHVTKIFTARGAVRAVDDVSIAIGKGELVTLLGPSGCGKTTTLRMIAGFEQPDEGRIILDGRDITTTPPNQRDTGMVFQSYAIFPHLTVDENIAYGLRVKRLSNAEVRRRVEAIAEVADLQTLLRRQPNQLSSGSRWPARSSWSRRCSSSTSRSPTSTPSSASRCASRSARSSSASRSPPSTSPTTRPRRWRSPIGSW
jgi:ABC-type Fe3+/spermidine/putrescine transport system ATPase subunit